jgi:hypothetical protein
MSRKRRLSEEESTEVEMSFEMDTCPNSETLIAG